MAVSQEEQPLVECVPNFSEGRDKDVIKQIADAIRHTEGVKLLHIDRGKAANRTVMTFAGAPEPVFKAAYGSIEQATDLIDMRNHTGEHPRIGATDVCPFIPFSGVSMDETIQLAQRLGKKVGEKLNIPVYLYEHAASTPERNNLANIRSGEYEKLEQKLNDPQWEPDYGPSSFNPKSGATVIGARDYLIAFNVNLNTNDVGKARKIASAIRHERRNHNKYEGLKTIGWYIEEYKAAQVSMNLTNITSTPLHTAFEAVVNKAKEYGLKVTGSEVIGLVPLSALLNTGKYFAHQLQKNNLSDAELIQLTINQLQLDAIQPFNPKRRILEYLL
jgi:glutamate formiminotransferase/formiminotetrahydrofolate cyclodeaminase